MKRTLPLLASAILAAPIILATAPAVAAEPPPPTEIAGGFVSPLKLALDVDGTIWVSDNFASSLNRIKKKVVSTPYTASPPGTELGAVSAFLGTTWFAERVGDQESVTSSVLKKRDSKGKVTQVADILAYEKAKNPDAKQTYGFEDLDPACAAQLPPGFPASYPGQVDSHVYGTLGTPIGTVLADAGANALFTVGRKGKVRTLAVLPPQPAVVGEWALALGFPECTIGETYKFEPVPTDVELGPDGWLYVTLLPGGPEDPSSGARGSVVKVDLLTGKQKVVATGFAGATDLAVSPKGDIYVAELFGGKISVIPKGSSTPKLWRTANSPAAVEWAPRGIYATIDAFPPGEPPAGKVVLFRF
jgi:hypothetical protein